VIRAYLLLMLRGYKAFLSPMLPNSCRFVPTCSEYAADAITHYGAFRGFFKALWRLLRCHPFSAGGYDPVILPENPAGTPAVTTICSTDAPEFRHGHSCLCSTTENSTSTTASRPHVWRC